MELHIDLSMVLQLLSKRGWGNHCGRLLVVKIRRLLEIEWEVVVHHSYQEANQCSEALINLECYLGYNMMVFETCSSQFNNLLATSVLGIVILCLVAL